MVDNASFNLSQMKVNTIQILIIIFGKRFSNKKKKQKVNAR